MICTIRYGKLWPARSRSTSASRTQACSTFIDLACLSPEGALDKTNQALSIEPRQR
jgi:hypothetical protein